MHALRLSAVSKPRLIVAGAPVGVAVMSALVALAAVGCRYEPRYERETTRCAPSGACPDGYTCADAGVCRRPQDAGAGAGEPAVDARTPDVSALPDVATDGGEAVDAAADGAAGADGRCPAPAAECPAGGGAACLPGGRQLVSCAVGPDGCLGNPVVTACGPWPCQGQPPTARCECHIDPACVGRRDGHQVCLEAGRVVGTCMQDAWGCIFINTRMNCAPSVACQEDGNTASCR